jgi:pantoate--beta-alanine ligase
MTTLFHTPSELRSQVNAWRKAGLRIGLVPTMGALHAGHLSLVTLAKQHADKVVASIFVNPTQFGPNEDFSRYPRMESADIAALETVGIDGVYVPSVEAIYPQGFATTILVKGITEMLCGAVRQGHFDGVATVVTKLLMQASPDVAVFGEKDYQQLHVIKQVVADLNLPVKILGAPIVREADGLAMSSRNQYLSAEERQTALALYQTLNTVAEKLKTQPASAIIPDAMKAVMAAGFDSVDYLELRSSDGLDPMEKLDRPARLLIAARLGKTRLIDNIAVEPTA